MIIQKPEGETTHQAIAAELDTLFEGFLELETFHDRLCPDSENKPKKKRKKP